MSFEPTRLAWPPDQAAQALEALAQRAGYATRPVELPAPAPDAGLPAGPGPWIEAAAADLGLEAEPVEVTYAELPQLLRRCAPALLRLPDGSVLAVLSARGSRLRLLAPDLRVRPASLEALRHRLCAELEAPLLGRLGRLLDESGVPARRQPRALEALLRERLGQQSIGGCWLLRLPPGASFLRQLHRAGSLHQLAGLLAAHGAGFGLLLLAWWMLGLGALRGRFDGGWLLAWALLLLTQVPPRLLATSLQGRLAVSAGGVFKRRLLHGALRLDPEAIRHQGSGQLLGRVMEAEAVEALALSGGFLALASLVELAFATAVLSAGAGGRAHVAAFGAWMLVTLVLVVRNYLLRKRWTGTRLEMTDQLVEQMVGHRTRLAQEPHERWHDGEDRKLQRYTFHSMAMDRNLAWLQAVLPRGWVLLALALLTPAFVAGPLEAAPLAVALGGVVLAEGALMRFAGGLSALASAGIAWDKVAPLFHAASRRSDEHRVSSLVALSGSTGAARGGPLLDAHDLVFRYRERGEPVLRGCSLRIQPGQRLLLEGPSGGGKSTLASLLTGLRMPERGLLLLGGLDRQTLGAGGWRQRVVSAPQFHENHVLTETFAFNLLMGRQWPPQPGDLHEAAQICGELGLGELLQRMPGGLLQMVGETGWQLSHGERSRLYIARALLQKADLVVLDESFAALDPENLRAALGCVLRRAPALLVIAHP